jgi:hypothetical protein
VDVIGLSAGEPDFDTPDFVKDAAIEAIRSRARPSIPNVDGIRGAEGGDRWQSSSATTGSTTPPRQISGERQAASTRCSTRWWRRSIKGDEVIIPAPYWVSYPDIVQFRGRHAGDSCKAGADQQLQDRRPRCSMRRSRRGRKLADSEFAVEPEQGLPIPQAELTRAGRSAAQAPARHGCWPTTCTSTSGLRTHFRFTTIAAGLPRALRAHADGERLRPRPMR